MSRSFYVILNFGAERDDRNPSTRLGRPATLHELSRIKLMIGPVYILNWKGAFILSLEQLMRLE